MHVTGGQAMPERRQPAGRRSRPCVTRGPDQERGAAAMTHHRAVSSPPSRHTRPSSLFEPLPEPAEPQQWHTPDSGSRVRLAPLRGLHRQDPLDSPRRPGQRWWILHVVLAAEVAVIVVILLGRSLAAWLGMP